MAGIIKIELHFAAFTFPECNLGELGTQPGCVVAYSGANTINKEPDHPGNAENQHVENDEKDAHVERDHQ